MPETFGHHPWTVRELVDAVRVGRVRLPDIQRPFVWSNAKVRDLIDSMYNGFPVGELMFWENSDTDHSRTIGTSTKSQLGSMQVIDGQQRLTSLYAVVSGENIVRGDYVPDRITISFSPLTERFAVPDNATRRSPDWIDDIRSVFDAPIRARRTFLAKLREVGGDIVDEDVEERVETAITRLSDVLSYQFQVVQLKPSVARETVADIFVRINSEGVKLSSTDFILTWLSVSWEEGRTELEAFARASWFTPQELSRMDGESVRWSPKNAYVTLDPGNVLRVVIAVGNKRAQLQDAYNVLRGRHPRTREIMPELRDAELALLKSGQARVLNPNHWDEYLKVIERAGIRTAGMVTSKNTLLFGYAFWLLGRTEFGVSVDELRETMARWYFMAQITGRYSGSAETRGQEDLNRLKGLDPTPTAFLNAINAQVDTALTEDWWRVTLPEELHTSSTAGPAYTGYIAALNILDADVLLSNLRVKDWIDPGRRPIKGIEKHHLFPRDYLRTALGIQTTRQINQVANQALVEWSDNIQISNEAPAVYWAAQVAEKEIGPDRLALQQWWHALPDGWTEMPYQEFLEQRRQLIAAVTREGFRKLSDPNYRPSVPVPVPAEALGAAPSPLFEDLVTADVIRPGTLLTPTDGESDSIAEVTEDGTIRLDDAEYQSPDAAARADGAHEADGWEYWSAQLDHGVISLAELRDRHAMTPVEA